MRFEQRHSLAQSISAHLVWVFARNRCIQLGAHLKRTNGSCPCLCHPRHGMSLGQKVNWHHSANADASSVIGPTCIIDHRPRVIKQSISFVIDLAVMSQTNKRVEDHNSIAAKCFLFLLWSQIYVTWAPIERRLVCIVRVKTQTTPVVRLWQLLRWMKSFWCMMFAQSTSYLKNIFILSIAL